MKISFGRWSESPLVHLSRGKDDHFGQIKCGAIRNIWRNTLRTWGPCENLKRTDREHEKVTKFNTHTRPPQKTKPQVFQIHALLPHCLDKMSIPTLVGHHFQIIAELAHESINQHGGFSGLFCICLSLQMEPCCVPLWLSPLYNLYTWKVKHSQTIWDEN